MGRSGVNHLGFHTNAICLVGRTWIHCHSILIVICFLFQICQIITCPCHTKPIHAGVDPPPTKTIKPTPIPSRPVTLHTQLRLDLAATISRPCHPAMTVKSFAAFWDRRRAKLTERFPWLRSIGEGGNLCVGCTICAKAKTGGKMATFDCNTREAIRPQKLVRHQNATLHQQAVGTLPTPISNVFKAVWNRFHNDYDTTAAGTTMKFGDTKARNVKYCIAEAIRNRQRADLNAASSIAIAQDAADTRHLVRYVACSPDLHVTSGILGMSRMQGAGHIAVLNATTSVLVMLQHHGAD